MSNLEDTSILANLADVDPTTLASALDKLQMLAEPINGPNSFNLETAAYGYITREERIVIPGALKDKMPKSVDDPVNLNSVELASITMYNYLRMKKRNLTDDHALFIALYRARLVSLGYLLREKEDRYVTVDEVDYPRQAKDHHGIEIAKTAAYRTAFEAATKGDDQLMAMLAHGTDDHFKKFIGFLASKTDITTYVTMAATQFAACTYLVFRQMGHHYKAELEGKYNVLWKATTLERPNFVPTNSEIHRSAIHSFGVYVLHAKFFKNYDAGLLAETFVERSDVTPCGVAVIKTCWASISLMQSLPIWGSLYKAYKEQMDQLKEQAEMLDNAREAIKYHKNARLFGKTRVYLDPSSAYALAPVAKGFLESMTGEVDIKKQKALDKRASQNPIAVSMIGNVIINIMERITNSGDLARALPSSGAPQVEEVK